LERDISNVSEIIKYTVMKKFKQADLLISLVLIVASIGRGLVTFDGRFIIGYFVVGGWQVISMTVHVVMGWFCKKGTARASYQWAVLFIGLITLLGWMIPVLLFIIVLFILFPLLFLSPLMATWYTWLCYEETYIKMKRPMALLK
jgi:hypothetical protein